MFFIHLSSALLPKQVSYRLLSSLARSQLRYNTQLFHSRLLDTVGYHYLLSFKRKWNDCFIKNRFLFHWKQPFFYSHFLGKQYRILLCSRAKNSREIWTKRSFTEAVAYVNLKCAVANLFPCSAYSKLVESWNLLYEVVLRPPVGFAERELKLY